MTDYKNELDLDELIKDHAEYYSKEHGRCGSGTISGSHTCLSDKQFKAKLEALLSQHSKKRELEARAEENRLILKALKEGSGLRVHVAERLKELDQLTNGEGRDED